MTAFPRWAWAPFGVGLALLSVPLIGMLARVSWAELPGLLTSERALDALRLSLFTCVISTTIVLLAGVPTALVLARTRGWWSELARTLVTVPMVLPPVVAGLALLVTFGRRGLIGQHLSAMGIEIGFTTVAVILAQSFVSLPFLIISVEGALRTSSGQLERVAANLGASPSRVFWRVTLPVIRPAPASGTALSFARSLGEFGGDADLRRVLARHDAHAPAGDLPPAGVRFRDRTGVGAGSGRGGRLHRLPLHPFQRPWQ
ncbi:MAG: ABC transporter permease subunit [Tessaracoccus sp.]